MKLIMTAIAMFLIGCSVSYGQKSGCETDQDVYDGRIIQIKGKVTVENRPDLDRFSGRELVFQRDGCKECLVAVRPNSDGTYELLVGEGRYKVIALDINCDYGGVTGCDCYEMLTPIQPRYVEAKRGTYPTIFDIKLRILRK